MATTLWSERLSFDLPSPIERHTSTERHTPCVGVHSGVCSLTLNSYEVAYCMGLGRYVRMSSMDEQNSPGFLAGERWTLRAASCHCF